MEIKAWSDMSDEELIKNIEERYGGFTLSEFNGRRAYVEAVKRKLIDTLLEKTIIITKRSRYGFYPSRSNEELLDLARDRNPGFGIREFIKKENALYGELKKRNLFEELLKEGTILRGKKKNGCYSNLSDDKLMLHVSNQYSDKTITHIARSDGVLYREIHDRDILSQLFENGVLVDNASPFKDLNYTLEKAVKAMEENGWEELPSHGKLKKFGYLPIGNAVQRYHGGLLVFREKLIEYLGKIPETDLDRLESLLDDYVGGSE
ncbi:hypothetical protein CMI37_37690 [Candidatus Pacearchaeota archaeon]|nr:hypothetical protein [Candidatus Pacearchaeota archaeon]|tara:strand:- start:1121 stop:1909 length:789 start_codon:yes stop_codon:yes gene_type:complete